MEDDRARHAALSRRGGARARGGEDPDRAGHGQIPATTATGWCPNCPRRRQASYSPARPIAAARVKALVCSGSLEGPEAHYEKKGFSGVIGKPYSLDDLRGKWVCQRTECVYFSQHCRHGAEMIQGRKA